MSVEVIEKIEDLVKDAFSDPVLQIGNLNYNRRTMHHIEEPLVSPLQVRTLDGVIDFIGKSVKEADLLVVVGEFNKVFVYGPLNKDKNRDHYLTATAETSSFPFGSFLPLDEVIIKIQSSFDDTNDKRLLLQTIGNIKEEEIIERKDDGISQEVRVKSGITTVQNKKLPSPVKLQPFRTFHEITQPISDYIVRGKKTDDLRIAIIEADGGEWKTDAIKKIKTYLRGKLKGITVV